MENRDLLGNHAMPAAENVSGGTGYSAKWQCAGLTWVVVRVPVGWGRWRERGAGVGLTRVLVPRRRRWPLRRRPARS